jgi:hypothetical protein
LSYHPQVLAVWHNQILTIHAVGPWQPGQVRILWSADTRLRIPEAEALIDQAWAQASARPGIHLFDGPMCRLESWHASKGALDLSLSRTSYKPFFGTNLSHPELADRFGPQLLANAIGVSPALLSADGYLMLGRRNSSVAYYPDRVHPFAGALEPRDDLDVFADVRRELAEELHFSDSDIADIQCTGIAEDHRLRQPELIFAVTSAQTRAQIESQLDATEHRGCWATRADATTLHAAARDPMLTPVAVAALLFWGRTRFGHTWLSDS